jgi:hypothetical protein
MIMVGDILIGAGTGKNDQEETNRKMGRARWRTHHLTILASLHVHPE